MKRSLSQKLRNKQIRSTFTWKLGSFSSSVENRALQNLVNTNCISSISRVKCPVFPPTREITDSFPWGYYWFWGQGQGHSVWKVKMHHTSRKSPSNLTELIRDFVIWYLLGLIHSMSKPDFWRFASVQGRNCEGHTLCFRSSSPHPEFVEKWYSVPVFSGSSDATDRGFRNIVIIDDYDVRPPSVFIFLDICYFSSDSDIMNPRDSSHGVTEPKFSIASQRLGHVFPNLGVLSIVQNACVHLLAMNDCNADEISYVGRGRWVMKTVNFFQGQWHWDPKLVKYGPIPDR